MLCHYYQIFTKSKNLINISGRKVNFCQEKKTVKTIWSRNHWFNEFLKSWQVNIKNLIGKEWKNYKDKNRKKFEEKKS